MADNRSNTYLLFYLVVLQTGAALDCPVGWQGFGSSCYKFVARSLGVFGVNWEDARAKCLGYAGDLVSVANKSEMEFIYNTSSKVINEHYWIGLRYQRNASSFAWSDGTPYNGTVYNNWLNGEPKHGGRVKICTELFLSSWIEVSCKNEYGYICERPKGLPMPTAKLMPPPATFTPIVCPPDWVFYGSSCYKFVSVPEKWIDAKKNCRSSGGYLVKIDSKDEQHYITLQLRHSANNMWIGLSDSTLEKTFIWEGDDSAVNYTHWGPGAPDNFGGAEDCVEVFSGAMAGFWNDDYCDSEKFYICERPNGQSICPVNWRNFGDSCYQFNVHAAHHDTWESAETACKTFNGAELVSVLDAKEQRYILKELKDMQITQVWLGLNDRSKEGIFQWSDRSVVKYVHWASHEPSKGALAGEQDCVLMDVTSRNGSWLPNSCTWKAGYICKRQIGLDQCDSPLGMEDGDIADGQITASSSLNMSTRARHGRLRLKARHNTLGAWCAASNKVGEYLQIDLGVVRRVTHIALQGRPESSDYVRTFFFKYGENRVDLNIYTENGTEKHKVFQGNSDGDSVRTVILPEAANFRFLRIYPLKWHNNICLRAEVYGCASQASSIRCGFGWEEGLNDTCYQFNTNERRLWADARANCIRRGGDLVSIASMEEKQWLLRRLKPLHRWSHTFWLGLNDRDMENRYYWSDGTPFKIASWDSGYPHDLSNLKSCVEIRSYFGTWRDLGCGEYRPYICKRKLVFEDEKKTPITGNWISGTDYYWPLDRIVDGKALGTVLATVVGNVTIPDEKQNERNVFHFEPSHAYLDAGQFTGQCITDPDECHYGITVSFVVRFEDGAKAWTRKIFIVNTIGDELLQNDRGFAVYVLNNQLCVFVLTERKSWSVKETLIVGSWHHVMFTWQRELGLSLYIDGKRKSSSTFGTTLFPPHTTENPLFVVGSRSDQPTAGGFYMRSLALWKRYLSEQAIDEVYLAEFGSCQHGWKAFGQFCYQLNRKMKQWHTARVACINEQADLVSIHSPVEQAFLDLEITSFVSDSDYWIGLNGGGGEQSEFEWSDNSDVEYSFWGSGEPNDWNGDKDCSLMFHTLESGWKDENCRFSQPYICKKRKEYIPSDGSPPVTVSHRIRVCDPGASYVSHRTIQCPFSFAITIISASWGYTTTNVCGHKGNTQCQLNVTLTLKSKCEGLPRCLIRISREDYQPDPCAGAFKYLEVNYKCIEAANSPGCPAGWKSTPDGSRCFGLLFDRKNWKQARDACKAYGADLASFHNKTENTVLTSLLVNSWDIAYVEGIWIGLSDSDQQGMYRWSDGSPLDYSSWMIGEPDDIQFTGSCVRATIQRGKVHWLFWKDNDCSDVLPYACSKDSKYQQPPSPLPSPLPTTRPPGACLSGWKLAGSSCYLFFPDRETWITARYRCKHHYSSDLVSIHSMEENNVVAQFLNGSVFTVWVGLSNRGVFKGYVWSDDTPVQFTNWKPEQPDSHQGQQPCVEMYSTGEWGDTGCYSGKPFICQRPRPRIPPATFSVPPPRTIPATQQASGICPPHWLLWNTMCYFYGDSSYRNWRDARRACLQTAKGADLVSIHSDEENEFIRTTFFRYSHWEAWIGLNDLGTKASYQWSDGSPLIYTNYEWRQPDDNQGQEDCTFMSGYGRWSDRHCSSVLKYICKTHNNSVILSPTNVTASPTPVVRECPDGWINYDKSCYLLVTSSLQSWQNARNACRTVLDDSIRSDLVTVNDQYEQAFLTSILLKKSLSVWIGINQLLVSGWYTWSDNDSPEYTNWDSRQPSSYWGYNCGQMTPHPGDRRWRNVPCDYKNGFICETGVLPIGDTTSPTTAAPEAITCPDRYERLGDNCYFVSYVKVTWQEAREACDREHGGDLISIDSPYEQAFVVRNMKNLQGGFWLGFYREANSSDFVWTDNSLPVLTKWASRQPYSPKTQRACVVSENSVLNAGLWYDVNCSARNGFICKIRKGEPYVTPQLTGSCPEGWMKFDKGCYRFETYFPMHWAGARMICQEQGGNLVSITSKQEQDFLSFHVRDMGESMIWIGLNDRAQERGYGWSDNSAVTFLNWAPEQPSNTGDKNCVIMGPGGLWKDWSCWENIGAICKRPLGCSEALGMASGSIPDAQITASSSIHASYGPEMARLDSLSSWCVNSSERGESIQIDLLAESRLTAIATQGFLFHGVQSFVQTFQLQTSDDAVTWKTYQKFGQNWVFVANGDDSSVVLLSLKPSVDTRFVRLLPLSWQNIICLRIELYGCKFACQTPLGMQSGDITNDFLSASSFSDVSHTADQARPIASAWCPKNSDVHPWLQIDFPGPEREIAKISTWGGGEGSGYVSIYRLAYKRKSTNWTHYTEGGKVRNFRGNQDTIHPETHFLAEPIIAQFLRLKPLSWSKLGACLRLELFGCQHGCDSALGLEHGLIKDSALSSSSFLDQAHAVTEVRLNGRWGWCASDSDRNPYFMVDFGKLMRIRKIGMQGAADGKGYIKTFTVSIKRDPGRPWKAVEKNGKTELFVANAGSTTLVMNTFASTLHARFIKVLPTNWNTQACFRLELYGCEPELQPTVFPSVSPGASIDVVYRGSVKLSKQVWTDDYEDSKSQVFKSLTAKLRSAIINVYSGTDEPSLAFREVAVTGFRRGSVVALFELTFYRDMAEDPGTDVTSKLVLAVRSGKLGELEVDPDSLTISKYDLRPTIFVEETVPPGASSSGLSDGAKAGVVIGALLLCGAVAGLLIWLFRKKRKWEGAIYKPCDHSVSFSATTEEANLL